MGHSSFQHRQPAEMHFVYFGLCSFQSLVCDHCSLIILLFCALACLNNSITLLKCIPVLLEGSPGVGKTSLVVALGEYSGHKVVRINLSEQV